MPNKTRSRTIIVTGGTAGAGRAIVERFARAGDRVGIIARDEAAFTAMQLELTSLKAELAFESADVADAEAVFTAAQALERKLGPIDIWINDAMETIFSPVADMTPAEFRRVTEVTYLGFVHGTMAALRLMRPRRRGRIVQMGSALAYRGIPLQSAYCGAKHAIRGFSDSLRSELMAEGSGITVTIVDLPAVNTPQFDWARAHTSGEPRPMGHPVSPTVVADAVYRAAEGSWREYWLGMPTILTILGNTVLPGCLDWYLALIGIDGQQRDTKVSPGRKDNLDSPITALHRRDGSFNAEASDKAILIPGELARMGIVATGALAFFCLGMRAARRRR